MLIYLGRGLRNYTKKPILVGVRRAWEFQAVLRGEIAPVHAEGRGDARSSHLWVFPPGYAHGWTSESNRGAEIVVFHFLFVPAALQSLAHRTRCFEVSLTSAHKKRLDFLAEQASRYWKHPGPGMAVCFEHILMELSLLVLESSQSNLLQSVDAARERVDAAIAWYVERMEQSPSLEAAACAVGVSPAHLRRIFHEVLQSSPKEVFDQLRFRRAMQLMADPATKLESVGSLCGFGSASAFSRAFKAKFGNSPKAWR